jgi:prepilin-type processing-associated H-X9-DG protein
VAEFVCPSRREVRVYPRPKGHVYFNGHAIREAGVIDYAANGGNADGLWYGGPASVAAAKTFDWNTNNALENTGISYARSEISVTKITDGTTHTYMLGEKYLDSNDYLTGQAPDDDMGMYEGCAFDTYRWAGAAPLRDRPGLSAPHRFGSTHVSGCHFAMCDGSVRSVSYVINLIIHQRLSNRADGQPIDAAVE